MMAAVRWTLLLASVHQRPGWQIACVVVAAALAGRLWAYLRPAGHQGI